MPAEVSAIRAGELKEIRAHGPRDTAVRGRMKAPRPSLREGLAVIEVDLASVTEHAGIRGRARSRARIVELGPRGDVVRPHGFAQFLCRGVAPPERVQVPGAVNVDGRGTVSVHDWIVRRPDGHGRCPRLRDVIEVRHVGEEVRRESLKADVRALAGRAVDRGGLVDVAEDRLIVPDAHAVIRSLHARTRVEVRRRGPHVFRGGARWVGPCGEYKEYGYEERESSPCGEGRGSRLPRFLAGGSRRTGHGHVFLKYHQPSVPRMRETTAYTMYAPETITSTSMISCTGDGALRPRSAIARARDHRRARDRLRRVHRVRRRFSHPRNGGLMVLQKNVAMTRAAGTSREKPGKAGTPALTARRALTLLIPVLLVLATWPYPASAATEYVWTTTADFDSGSSVQGTDYGVGIGYDQPIFGYISKPSAIYSAARQRTYVGFQVFTTYLLAYMTYFDHVTKAWATPVAVGPTYDPLVDGHGAPSIYIDGAGYLYSFWGSHATAQKLSKSVRPHDISAWTQLNDPCSAPCTSTYPSVFSYGGKIYFYHRQAFAQGGPWRFHTSTNGGVTWTVGTDFLQFPGMDGAYFGGHIQEGSSLWYSFAKYQDSDATRRNVYTCRWDLTTDVQYGVDGTNLGATVNLTDR